MTRRTLKLYVFTGAGGCDYTCGDRIVAAYDMEEAHRIVGHAKTQFGGDAGPHDDPVEYPIKGFDYIGPGGG